MVKNERFLQDGVVNGTVQVTPVILRDFQPKDVSSLLCNS
jgi:hypothetical protein